MATTSIPAPATGRRGRIPLWGLRSRIPQTTGRMLGIASISLVLIVWCVLSYVSVTRDGKVEPLVSHFFLPPPDEVLRACCTCSSSTTCSRRSGSPRCGS